MNYYDLLIRDALALNGLDRAEALSPQVWKDAGKQNLVLQKEMAYELGGGTLPAVSFLAATTTSSLIGEGGAFLLGPDLSSLSANAPYARITLLLLKDGTHAEDESLYTLLRRLEYTRYRVNPSGFMVRISSTAQREPARISRTALQDGLSFSAVGSLYVNAYLAHPEVAAAKTIFVTEPQFDYDALSRLALCAEQTTQALDHVLRDVKMDCDSCGLQAVCNEVERLRAAHFDK